MKVWAIHKGHDATLIQVVYGKQRAQKVVDDLKGSIVFAEEWDAYLERTTGRIITTPEAEE